MRILFCSISILSILGFARGGVPTNDGLFPCGGKPGTSVEISLSGKATPWPPKFWCSNPDLTIEAGPKSPQATITIPKNAKPGPCLIRTWNTDGCSDPFIFLVGQANDTEVLEDEKSKNRGLDEAQVIQTPFPSVLYGRLNPSKDVDCFQLQLKKGQTLYAFMEAYTFRSGLDGMIHLYNSKGENLALAHDNPVNQDPQLVFPIPVDDTYTLAVMAIATPPTANVFFHGGSKCSYRINLALSKRDLPARLRPTEGKPDSDLSKPLTPPVDLFGSLDSAGNHDTVTFIAEAKKSYQIDVESFTHRFPTDPVIRLNRPENRLVKEVDDGTRDYPDSNYLYKATVDGEHTIEIQDRYGRTGPSFRYRLRIANPVPGFSSTVDKSSYLIEPGKEITIKLKVNRINGHKSALKLNLSGLPDHVKLIDEPEIPEKSGEVSLKLKAKEDTETPFSGPIQISLQEQEGDKQQTKLAGFSFRDKTTPAPFLIDEATHLWLTVKVNQTDKKEK